MYIPYQYGSAFWRIVFGRPRQAVGSVKLLFVVEGAHDIAFMIRLSSILHRDDPSLPNLADWERLGKLVFLPFGGGDVVGWARRLAPIGMPTFYLFDREAPPESTIREQAAMIVNQRSNCRAFVTKKRALENYLDSQCILEAKGIDVDFGDDDDVADLVARKCYESPDGAAWDKLSGRARKRFRERVKRWLNRDAVDRMKGCRVGMPSVKFVVGSKQLTSFAAPDSIGDLITPRSKGWASATAA